MASIHGTRTAFALNVFVPISGLDDITADLALNSIFDDFSHNMHLLLAQHNTAE
jgi:hypothetical protein